MISVRPIVAHVRLLSEMSKAERLLSYSLFSLVTGKQLAMTHTEDLESDEEEEHDDPIEAAKRRARKGKSVVNSSGAWCWKGKCQRKSLIPSPTEITHYRIQSASS